MTVSKALTPFVRVSNIMKKSKNSSNDDTVIVNGRQGRWPTVDGMEAFCGMTGAPLPVVKKIKRDGSQAFLSTNRIDPLILLKDIFAALAKGSELPDGIATPQDWLATEKARRESIKRQQDEKSVMLTAEAKRQNGLAWAFVFSQLEKLALEGPPDFAGRTAVELGIRLNNFKERMRVEAQEKFEGKE